MALIPGERQNGEKPDQITPLLIRVEALEKWAEGVEEWIKGVYAWQKQLMEKMDYQVAMLEKWEQRATENPGRKQPSALADGF